MNVNAIQFIKEHGIEKAREVVEGAPDGVMLFEYIPICSGFSYIKIIDGIRYCFNQATNNWFIDNFKAEISFQFNDIKRLVESVDLIDSLGGLELSKKESNDCRFYEYADMSHRAYAIKQAIADYESIYSDNNMGECEILEYPESSISPNCKVGVK